MTNIQLKKWLCNRNRIISLAIAALIVLILLGITLYFTLVFRASGADGRRGNGPAAVTAISKQCTMIGRDALVANGSAVDAALATLFCETVCTPQSMGLGGGFAGIVYTRQSGVAESIVARETAPASASENMFDKEGRVEGIRAFAVPGELRGYGELHERYGRLPWRRLVQPAIDLSRNGFVVTPFLERALQYEFGANPAAMRPEFVELFWNAAKGRLVRYGEVIRNERYARTLELVAVEGPGTLYDLNGTVARQLVADMQDAGGLVTAEDLQRYRVQWDRPLEARLPGERQLYTAPLPASGGVLVFVMNLLEGMLPESLGFSVLFYHRLVEAFKFAYALRSNLSDPLFVPEAAELQRNLTSLVFAAEVRKRVDDKRTYNETEHYGASFSLPEDHGTAQISVLAPNGDAVSITSTVNTYFGAKLISSRTGIVLNDQMDDFSLPNRTNFYGLPPSPQNYIAPGKRPMSSMCPTIVLNGAGDVEVVVGAAGGSKITTAVASVIIRYLYRNQTMTDAIAAARVHHQLVPMAAMYETGFDEQVLAGLRRLGHACTEIPPSSGFGSVSAIAVNGAGIEAVSDARRNGSAVIWQP